MHLPRRSGATTPMPLSLWLGARARGLPPRRQPRVIFWPIAARWWRSISLARWPSSWQRCAVSTRRRRGVVCARTTRQRERMTFDCYEQCVLPNGDTSYRKTGEKYGLVPAVATVFPDAKHAFCQMHYLKNAAEPVAEADQSMKITLRKGVRVQVGKLIRQEKVEQTGVLTVTGLIPLPVEEEP